MAARRDASGACRSLSSSIAASRPTLRPGTTSSSAPGASASAPLVTVHQFRHSCASDLLEAGVHLAEVQRILGHQGIATTVRYAHIADPARRAAIARHPVNDFLQVEALAA